MTSSSSSKSVLAPMAPFFYGLNWVAFVGWSYVLTMLLNHTVAPVPVSTVVFWDEVQSAVVLLESICALEVVRILLGDLPGSLALGVILHAIRFTVVGQVLPRGAIMEANFPVSNGISIVKAILYSWTITEVTRYPMYLFPNNQVCRSVRMVVPLLTFPMGALAEGYGAFTVFRSRESLSPLLQLLLIAIMFVNGILGPVLAYPHIFWKAAPILGLVRERKMDSKRKKE